MRHLDNAEWIKVDAMHAILPLFYLFFAYTLLKHIFTYTFLELRIIQYLLQVWNLPLHFPGHDSGVHTQWLDL